MKSELSSYVHQCVSLCIPGSGTSLDCGVNGENATSEVQMSFFDIKIPFNSYTRNLCLNVHGAQNVTLTIEGDISGAREFFEVSLLGSEVLNMVTSTKHFPALSFHLCVCLHKLKLNLMLKLFYFRKCFHCFMFSLPNCQESYLKVSR